MAISIDWITGVVFIPRADMPLVSASPTEVRELDIDAFRLVLGDLKDDVDGRPWTKVHDYTPPKTISGTTLFRVVEIVSPYTVTFENGLYNVNIVGGNSNISEVNNKNSVGVNTSNSAGGQVITSIGGGLTEQELHDGLDSYPNKDDWKATIVASDAPTAIENAQAVWDFQLPVVPEIELFPQGTP